MIIFGISTLLVVAFAIYMLYEQYERRRPEDRNNFTIGLFSSILILYTLIFIIFFNEIEWKPLS